MVSSFWARFKDLDLGLHRAYLTIMRRPLPVAAGTLLLGYLSYFAISSPLESPKSSVQIRQVHSSSQSPSSTAVSRMLHDVRNKSAREKIEGAYDASIKTHEIGFPDSLSRSQTPAKMGQPKGIQLLQESRRDGRSP